MTIFENPLTKPKQTVIISNDFEYKNPKKVSQSILHLRNFFLMFKYETTFLYFYKKIFSYASFEISPDL